MQIEALHQLFAARVTGIDVAQGVSADEAAMLRDALDHHGVLVFPDQRIDDAAQIAFSQGFGPLETTRAGANGAGSAVIVLTNIGPDGAVAPPSDKQVLNNRANMLWHHDSSFKPVPARASMLSARVTPSAGADTEFACTRAGFAALPAALRGAAEGRIAVHDFGWSRSRVTPELVSDAERADHPPVRQHVVQRANPAGPALYLGAHARMIDGLPEAEGRALIDALMEAVTAPGFVYRHRWAPHDLVLWDNMAVLHRATPFAAAQERRRMVRTTIAGDASLALAAAA